MLFTKRTNSDIENGSIKPDAPPQQLYNLKEDPRQTTNVIRDHADIAREMKTLMQRLRAEPVRQPSATAGAR